MREVEALEPMTFSLLTERRRVAPARRRRRRAGPAGPQSAHARGGQEPVALPSKAEGRLQAGDRLRLETPGGGGYGARGG